MHAKKKKKKTQARKETNKILEGRESLEIWKGWLRNTSLSRTLLYYRNEEGKA